MTKPTSRKMAVDCLLDLFRRHIAAAQGGVPLDYLKCGLCLEDLLPEQPIQFDHIHADVFDGPHEYQNLRPVHADCHKKKTTKDIAANAKVKRILAGGRKKRGRKMASRPFPKRNKKG